MKQFKINGLKKRQYRGNSLPTLQTDTIKAESKEKAGAAFEKKHPSYNASAIVEVVGTNKDMATEAPDINKDLANAEKPQTVDVKDKK